MAIEHFDVLIVGAGLSGIGAGYHLQTRCPGKRYAILEGRDTHRRHLGPVPLSRHPLGLGHVHAGLRVPALERGQGHRRRPVDPEVHARDGARVRHRPPDPLRPPGASAPRGRRDDARWTVEAERGAGEAVRFTCNFLFLCSGYYDYDGGYTPEFPGVERFDGRDRAPAEVAGGPRLRRQAGGGDRQRRHRRDAGAGDGQDAPRTSPCCSARPPTSSRGPAEDTHRQLAARASCPRKLAYGITRWKNVLLRHVLLQPVPGASPARVKRADPERRARQLGPGLRRRHALHAALQPLGPAPVPGARRRPVRRDQRAAEPRWSPTRSRPSPRRASG